MSRLFGQQFVVENVTGAGGTTGSTRAMRARPDGYTILMGHTGTHAFSLSFYPNLAYKPDADFEPIGTVLEIPELIVARKDLPPSVPVAGIMRLANVMEVNPALPAKSDLYQKLASIAACTFCPFVRVAHTFALTPFIHCELGVSVPQWNEFGLVWLVH